MIGGWFKKGMGGGTCLIARNYTMDETKGKTTKTYAKCFFIKMFSYLIIFTWQNPYISQVLWKLSIGVI